MLKKAVLGALAALSCNRPQAPANDPPPVELPPQLHACAPYARVPNALGFCIYKSAGNLPSPMDVNRICPLAGDYERECRRSWVASRSDTSYGYATEALISVCAGDPDCAFEMLDKRPVSDVLVQLEYCAGSAGPYSSDCAVHAMERWMKAGPSLVEVQRVEAASTRFPQQVGYGVGMALACYGLGSCQGVGSEYAMCQNTWQKVSMGQLQCPRAQTPSPGAFSNPGQ